jgi:multidrug efflux pump subunit AcrB
MGSAAVSIAGTALCLYLLDIPANLLTLAGLGMGIGVLVQNGLMVVERLRTVDDTPAARADAGRRIMPAVVGSTLTTAVVLFPFLYLQGNARAAFVPFAAAFALALLWSVIASVVMIPAVGAGHGMQTGHWPRVQRFYDRTLIRLMRWRYATIAFCVIALGVLGWGFATRVERVSFSGFGGERTTLQVGVSFPRGSDPEALDRAIREFESIVVGREGVEQVRAQGYGGGFARMEVLFSKEAAYTAIPAMMQDELTQRAVLVGGAQVSVFGRGQGFASGGGGGTVGFRIKLLGYSFEGVERLAMDLQHRLEAIPRVRMNINAGSFWGPTGGERGAGARSRGPGARGATATEFGAVAREAGGPGGVRLESKATKCRGQGPRRRSGRSS